MSQAARYFSRRRALAEFMAAGSVAPVLDELTTALEAAGYSTSTIQGYVRAARHVTYALERHEIRRRDLTLAGLRSFARTHHASCRCPHPEKRPSANFRSSMSHLLPILRRRGLAAADPGKPFADVLADLDAYMAGVRGASEATRHLTVRTLVPVLSALMRRERFDPARLTAPALQQYVAVLAERRSPSTVARTVVAIRALLRFLLARGADTSTALALLRGPRRVRYRPSEKALTMPQVRALLAPLRRRGDALALRDLAILLLLGQSGLRRTDVTRLELQDFDARESTVTVRRTKSRRAFELPVPEEARDAVLRYVRHGRPKVRTRALFVAHSFPYDRGISERAVSAVVERAFRRSGVEHTSRGAHVLRHTLATQLVAARQPLKAIADVMRHREIDTTARYVSVDLARLRAVASAWPEVRGDVQT